MFANVTTRTSYPKIADVIPPTFGKRDEMIYMILAI